MDSGRSGRRPPDQEVVGPRSLGRTEDVVLLVSRPATDKNEPEQAPARGPVPEHIEDLDLDGDHLAVDLDLHPAPTFRTASALLGRGPAPFTRGRPMRVRRGSA
jgi:hypothetical protein